MKKYILYLSFFQILFSCENMEMHEAIINKQPISEISVNEDVEVMSLANSNTTLTVQVTNGTMQISINQSHYGVLRIVGPNGFIFREDIYEDKVVSTYVGKLYGTYYISFETHYGTGSDSIVYFYDGSSSPGPTNSPIIKTVEMGEGQQEFNFDNQIIQNYNCLEIKAIPPGYLSFTASFNVFVQEVPGNSRTYMPLNGCGDSSNSSPHCWENFDSGMTRTGSSECVLWDKIPLRKYVWGDGNPNSKYYSIRIRVKNEMSSTFSPMKFQFKFSKQLSFNWD